MNIQYIVIPRQRRLRCNSRGHEKKKKEGRKCAGTERDKDSV
jgi:hypothetical protein